jgi:hypothetical protein
MPETSGKAAQPPPSWGDVPDTLTGLLESMAQVEDLIKGKDDHNGMKDQIERLKGLEETLAELLADHSDRILRSLERLQGTIKNVGTVIEKARLIQDDLPPAPLQQVVTLLRHCLTETKRFSEDARKDI